MKKKTTYCTLILCISLILIAVLGDVKVEKESFSINEKTYYTAHTTSEQEESEVTYLSDLNAIQASTSYGQIVKDKTQSGSKITVKVEGSNYTFEKGIFAHATSTLVYDLGENHDYDWFVTYVGLNATSSGGNGVKYYVYTAGEDKNYTLRTEEGGILQTAGANSRFVQVNVKGVRYLKLYAHDNGSNGMDHSVYADAKLVKGTPKENTIKTTKMYDELIKTKYQDASLDNEELELALLQRNLIDNVGNFTLVLLKTARPELNEIFNWLFDDLENLRMYTMGGRPSGTYIKSFEVLKELYDTYKEDLNDDTLTEDGIRHGDIYKRMMMAISLTHSKEVRFWIRDRNEKQQVVNDPDSYNVSKPVNRYAVFKKMFKAGKLSSFFKDLEVEEMRLVVNVELSDNEIEWLRDFTEAKGTNQPYPYIAYVHDRGYWQARHYVDINTPTDTGIFRPVLGPKVDTWGEKYLLNGYGIETKPYYPHLWMVMDEGGVCWQTANLGQNMMAVWGYPSVVLGQPGHSVFATYTVRNGKVQWGLGNDISSWPGTNLTGYNNIATYHQQRVLAGWGNGSYASSYNASYILLGQQGINDMEGYQKAEEYVQLAKVYEGDVNKQEEIYRNALNAQKINLDAWIGLINTYKNNPDKKEEDYFNLAKEVANALTYAPLPMYDMLRLIAPKITSPGYLSSLTMLQTKTLQNATKATASDHDQYGTVVQMAKHLLGGIDKEIATFSFDGENAGKIKLNQRYSQSMLWEYSIDGNQTWIEVNSNNEVTLTKEQIASLTEQNDILVHIIGVPRNEETVYTIDIMNGILPTLYGNDLENRVIGARTSLEWRYTEYDDWKSYQEESPDLTGNKTVEVRNGATGRYLASTSRTFTFTEDNQPDTRKYVSVSHLSIHSVSSQATGSGQNGQATNAIDGNYNSRWHSAWNGSDSNKWIIIKLDKPIYLSAIEYVPADGGNGKILNAKFEGSMDGETFDIDLGSTSLWGDDRYWGGATATRKIDYTEEYKQQMVQYIKITGTRTSSAGGGNFIAARMFNIYQDVTKNPHPTAGIAYSTDQPTTGKVIARLVNKSEGLIITNNEGNDTYTFTENGSFTFEFEDAKGNTGSATAKVNNIDHKAPEATVEYSPNGLTTSKVTATLSHISEDIYLLDNDNKKVNHIEVANEQVIYIAYLNEEGKTTKILNLNDRGETESITYFYQDITYTIAYDEKGLVTNETFQDQEGNEIDPENKDEIRKLNLTGRSKPLNHEFDKNGSYTFRIQDKAGNISEIKAEVNFITGVNASITYSTDQPTTKEVVATLSFDANDIRILNNGGRNTYVFKENGSFTFEYLDTEGNKRTITATVNWIEKEHSSTIPSLDYNKKPNSSSTQSNNQSSTNKQEPKTKKYSLGNVEIKVQNSDQLKNSKINKNNILLPDHLKSIVGVNYDCFEIYLTDDKNMKISIESNEIQVTIKLDSQKELVELYELNEDALTKMDYKKDGNILEFKTPRLGKYVIQYKEETKEDQNKDKMEQEEPEDTKKNWNKVFITLGSIGAAVAVSSVTIHIKRKDKKAF